MKKVFASFLAFIGTAFFAVSAFAEEAVAASGADASHKTGLAIAAGFAIAIAAFGGALGQGKTAATTLEGIARNPEAAPKLLTPMIIALALIESLVIYALVIAFLLQAKI